MNFQYDAYIWPLAVSATIAAGLGVYAWRHRSVPGGTPFAVVCLIAALWAVANALEMAGSDLPTKLVWANVQYLVYAGLPLAWLALVVQYSGRGAWLTGRRLALLAIVPAITVVLAWTNEAHGLIRQNVYLDSNGPFPVIGKTYGPWFWVNILFSYLLFAASIYLLLAALRRTPRLYRRQAVIILIGLLLPLVWNVLYVLGLSPAPRHDLAPAMLCVSGAIVAIGLFRFRLFEIGPLAREMVIDSMSDGMAVLDTQGRIVDLNPAAQGLLGAAAWQAIGQAAEQAFAAWPELVALCSSPAADQVELSLVNSAAPRAYDVQISPLAGRDGQALGRVIVWRDVTDRRQAEAQLVRQQRVLAGLEERERLARSLHDNLAQVLSFASMQALAARELLADGQTERADAYLSRLADATQEAHADAREYILGVRTGISATLDFQAALEQYLQRFGQTCGLQTELALPDPEAQPAPALEPIVEIQLLRIVQEALTNVRKHAAARRVRVSYRVDDGQAQVVVEDDGCGFDPARLLAGDAQSFGLQIMRERAEEIGGSVEVLSAPGQGTRITVRAPRGGQATA